MRFAYAGESTIERRSVVNEEGSEDSESEKGASGLGLVSVVVFASWGGNSPRALARSRSCCRS